MLMVYNAARKNAVSRRRKPDQLAQVSIAIQKLCLPPYNTADCLINDTDYN